MKMLTITDEHSSGTALLCEFHFKQIQDKIVGARAQGVTVVYYTVKTRGCRLCMADKVGFSRWCGPMFSIWRGFKNNESR